MEFGERLKQLRERAGLTQDELGSLVDRDARTIRSWEKGRSLPPPERARKLAVELGLTGIERGDFITLATGGDPAQAAIASAARTLPRDVPSFTGRNQELRALKAAAASAPDSGGVPQICVIHGMPGVGKTALAVHVAHEVAADYPGGQFSIDLYGHSVEYRRPVQPKDALSALLMAAGVPSEKIPSEPDDLARTWRHWTAEHKVLLLLDDAWDADQVGPLLPGSAGNLVLITTRNDLLGLHDVIEVFVEEMTEPDAALLFTRVAGRPGLSPRSREVTDVVGKFGGLPIVIAPMAAQLRKHRHWPASNLIDLHDRIGALNVRPTKTARVADWFDLSYRNLPDGLQRLFRLLALHPGPELDADTVAALAGSAPGAVLEQLEELYGYHLISEPASNRYRFHDLVREFARTRAAHDQPVDRKAAERRLLDYYLYMASVADQLLTGIVPTGIPGEPIPRPHHAPGLRDRDDAFGWLDDNRDRLHAAAEYAYAHGYREYAKLIPAYLDEYLVRHGHWNQARDLHQLALRAAGTPAGGLEAGASPGGDVDWAARARALLSLGGIWHQLGDPMAEIRDLREAQSLYEQVDDKVGQARVLRKLGAGHLAIGDYPQTLSVWSAALELFRRLGDKRSEFEVLGRLGVVQYEQGDTGGALASLSAARDMCAELDDPVGQANALCYLGIIQADRGEFDDAIAGITEAMGIFQGLGDNWNVAGARYFLGVALRLAGRFAAARVQLDLALAAYLEAADKYDEAGVRNQIGQVEMALGDFGAARISLDQALRLYADYGGEGTEVGRLEVLNSLGELAIAAGDPLDAERYHRMASEIATEKQVPRELARAWAGTGRAQRMAGRPDEGAESLRVALEIYERLESPEAGRIADLLRTGTDR
ncbi:MAG TPA: tetratricopeptide repeat protein [Trebonia sp.]|nr:tetratricopeptide repeat protein [Trebonia sp.]